MFHSAGQQHKMLLIKGRDDISNGRQYTTEEAKEHLSRWLKP
ncbi:MAG: hypothetical protein ACNYZG_09845 [Gammaproteobacteria bacterium]